MTTRSVRRRGVGIWSLRKGLLNVGRTSHVNQQGTRISARS